MPQPETLVGKVDVSAYTIPTDAPEGDGPLRWDSTTSFFARFMLRDRPDSVTPTAMRQQRA